LDFIKDLLNSKLVNAELTEADNDGMVVLKSNKEEFRSCEWSLTNNLDRKKSMSAYHINASEITKAAFDNQTSKMIKKYIVSHVSWENSTNHSSVNVLVYKENSC